MKITIRPLQRGTAVFVVRFDLCLNLLYEPVQPSLLLGRGRTI